jgi:hypothetical protein
MSIGRGDPNVEDDLEAWPNIRRLGEAGEPALKKLHMFHTVIRCLDSQAAGA